MTRKVMTTMMAVALFAIGFLTLAHADNISGAEARKLVDGGATLVDVRTPEEFAQGHLPKAVNVPVQELDRRMTELKDKDAALVVYCRSGGRSARASEMLRKAGYKRVYDLGAMSRW